MTIRHTRDRHNKKYISVSNFHIHQSVESLSFLCNRVVKAKASVCQSTLVTLYIYLYIQG